MDYPFLEENNVLLVLDSKVNMNELLAETVRKVETHGQDQYNKFVDARMSKCIKPVKDSMPKNKLPLFSQP